MNRRGFLKGLGFTATAVAIPTIVSTQQSIPTFKSNGLYTEDELDIYEEKITTLINLFSEKVEIAWNSKDTSILPLHMIQTYTNELSKHYGYTLQYDDIIIDDSLLDRGFINMIKYDLLKGDYTKSRSSLQSWKHAWGKFLVKEQEKQMNTMYMKLCTELNLQHKVKKLNLITSYPI